MAPIIRAGYDYIFDAGDIRGRDQCPSPLTL